MTCDVCGGEGTYPIIDSKGSHRYDIKCPECLGISDEELERKWEAAERIMSVLTKAQAEFIIAGMRSNFPYQITCDLCRKPLGDDRHEAMHGPFPICVHGKCRDLLRDLMISHKLDRRGGRGSFEALRDALVAAYRVRRQGGSGA